MHQPTMSHVGVAVVIGTSHDRLLFASHRHKRGMGLTLAEAELSRLDQERVRDRVTLERERSYAENIVTKIEDILWVRGQLKIAVA